MSAVISDRKIPRSSNGTTTAFYMPDFVSATDYYPFGMTMQERTFTAGGEAYRFGFNGKENDNESNTQDYGMRIYDGRLGRFLSVDPLASHYPWYSPYIFSGNNPIMFVDLDGGEEKKSEPPKQNILIVIPTAKEIATKNYEKVGGDQGTWFVIIANDMVSAEKQLGAYLHNSEVSNVVIVTHGALVNGTIMLSNQMPLFDSKIFDKYNSNTLKNNDIKIEITAMKKISGFVKPGGNLLIAACLTGNGKEGAEITSSMKQTLKASINLLVSKGVVTGPDPDINSYDRKAHAFTNLQLDVPLIDFNLSATDNYGYKHKNKPGEGFIYIGSNSNRIIDIGQTPGYTGNVILHETGSPAIEPTKQISIKNKE